MSSPSRSPLPPPSPSHLYVLYQCTGPEHLSHASNLDWRSVSQLIIYMFQYYSLWSSHPRLLQESKSLFYTSVIFSPSLIMPLMSGRKAISFSIISPLCLLLLLLPPPFLPSIPPSLSLTPKHTHIYGCLEESDVKISCQIFSKLPTDVWLGCTGAFTEKCHLSLYASEQKHGLNFTKVEKWCSVLFCVL